MKMKFIVASALLLIAGNSNATNNNSVQQQLDDLKAGLHQVHINTTQKYSESWGLEDRANIGKLQEQKLDKSVFAADQARQDKATGELNSKVDGYAQQGAAAYSELTQKNASQDQAIKDARASGDFAQGIGVAAQLKADKVSKDLSSAVSAQSERDAGQDKHINAVQNAAQIANDRASNLEVRADGAEQGIRDVNKAANIANVKADNLAVRADGIEAQNAKQARQISNEVNDRVKGDRLNAQQIAAANANIEAGRKAAVATNQRVDRNTATLANHEGRIGALENNVNQNFRNIDGRFNRLEKRMEAGVSTAMAAAGIPQVTEYQTFAMGAAVGGYESGSALAVGFSARASQNTVVKAAVATDNQHGVGYNVGLSVGW